MKRLGIVLWFDELSGEGVVLDLATGKHLYCHYSSIQSKGPFKKLHKRDRVEFSIYKNLYMCQVDKVRALDPADDAFRWNEADNMAAEREIDLTKRAPEGARY